MEKNLEVYLIMAVKFGFKKKNPYICSPKKDYNIKNR